MAKLYGYKNPQDPLSGLSKKSASDGSGTYVGKYSALNSDRQSRAYNVQTQKLVRSDDAAGSLVKPASNASYESRFAGVGPDAPDVGGVDDGRSSPNR
jgi:hypothetical protein